MKVRLQKCLVIISHNSWLKQATARQIGEIEIFLTFSSCWAIDKSSDRFKFSGPKTSVYSAKTVFTRRMRDKSSMLMICTPSKIYAIQRTNKSRNIKPSPGTTLFAHPQLFRGNSSNFQKTRNCRDKAKYSIPWTIKLLDA